MKYYIRRDLNEYGPYTLAYLQRYVAQGNISPSDLTRSEGMADWVPVGDVIGNIPAPPMTFAQTVPATMNAGYGVQGETVYSGGTVHGGPGTSNVYAGGQGTRIGNPQSPVPPDFHWALVLLISFFCGIFQVVWLFIEISFVRKIRPENSSLALILSGIGIQFAAVIMLFAVAFQGGHDAAGFTIFFWLIVLTGSAFYFVGYFKMREALLEYYNTEEPINLRLSGVMTFFFSVFYFQYHFSRIAAWKKTGYLAPQ